MAPAHPSLERTLREAQRYFMGEADIHKAVRRLVHRLDELGIPYAIVGGIAVAAHGHLRMTLDIDLVLAAEDLARFREGCVGRGWTLRFAGSRGVRDTEFKVPIDIVLAGDYPGDGKPKPVRFPEPRGATVDMDGIAVVTLPRLIELKIASGTTAPERPRDLDDVIQLIRVNGLSKDFAAQLDPSVRTKFEELWGYAQIERL